MTKSQAHSQIAVLAIGDRIGLIKKLFEMFRNLDPALLDGIGKLIGFFGGGAGTGIWEAVKKILDLLKKPATASIGDDDLDAQIKSVLCSCNVSEAEFDTFLSATK